MVAGISQRPANRRCGRTHGFVPPPLDFGGSSSYLSTITADSPTFILPMYDASGGAVNLLGTGLTDPGGVNSPNYGLGGPTLLGATPDTSIEFLTAGGTRFLFGPSMATSAFDLAQGNFTLEAWVAVYSFATPRTIARVNYATSGNYLLRINAAGQVEGYNGANASGTTVLAAGVNWYHVAMVRTSANLQVFLNGVADSASVAGQVNGVGTGAGSEIHVGVAPGGLEKFDGRIAWIAGYKSALSAVRLLAHFNAR